MRMSAVAASMAGNDSDEGGTFCPDPLWDRNVTWDTDDPNLTECFRNTVLAAVPPVVLALHLPFYAADLRRRWQSRSLFAEEEAAGGCLHWIRCVQRA